MINKNYFYIVVVICVAIIVFIKFNYNQKITELIPFEKMQYNEDVMYWYAWAKKNLKEVIEHE